VWKPENSCMGAPVECMSENPDRNDSTEAGQVETATGPDLMQIQGAGLP
jgi:hypothetical protein